MAITQATAAGEGRKSHWLNSAAALLIVVGIPWALIGVVGVVWAVAETTKTCEPTLPICRNFAFIGVTLAAVGLFVGGAHLVAGIGSLRGSAKARGLAWVVATVGAVSAAYLAITTINPAYNNESDGTAVYNSNGRTIALTLIPYLAVMVLMLIDRLRRRSKVDP